MDDFWGDDLDADVMEEIEECLLMATQATTQTNTSNAGPDQSANITHCKEKSSVEFKQPVQSTSFNCSSSSSRATMPSKNTVDKSKCDASDVERLKEENRRLAEANLTKAGEASILRADVQSLKTALEKKELESSQQLAALKKQVQQMDANHHKQIEASKTEMRFKELELEELRNKCKRIEQGRADLIASTKPTSTPVRESPTPGRGFLNRTTFDSAKFVERKAILADAEAQTDVLERFRLDPCDTERLDNGPKNWLLVDTLRFRLLSADGAGNESLSSLLEQLRIRIILKDEEGDTAVLANDSEPSIGELVVSNLERVKNTNEFKAHIDFITCWITCVLPSKERSKSDGFIQSLLSNMKRFALCDILVLCSAIASGFGLAPVCNKRSGCLLEKAALQLKDGYLSFNAEEQYKTAEQLIVTLSAMIASPPTDNLRKCTCIAHLLKALTLVVQHQVELEGLSVSMADRRLKLLIQAFRLSLSVLHCRREPWRTFVNSPTEVNRLFTVLTAISVDFPIPKELSNEIDVAAFYTGAVV